MTPFNKGLKNATANKSCIAVWNNAAIGPEKMEFLGTYTIFVNAKCMDAREDLETGKDA